MSQQRVSDIDCAWFAKGLWAVYGEELPEPPYAMIRRVLTYLESIGWQPTYRPLEGLYQPTQEANGGD